MVWRVLRSRLGDADHPGGNAQLRTRRPGVLRQMLIFIAPMVSVLAHSHIAHQPGERLQANQGILHADSPIAVGDDAYLVTCRCGPAHALK